MISVRTTQIEDIDQISLVLATSWKSAYRGIVDDDYLDSLKSNHWVDFLTSGLNNSSIFSMVVENNRQIIGAAILKETEKESEVCLLSFYLLPDKIGQGIGHIFYTGIETELKNSGFSNCILDVLENNKRAIRFYEAHRFIETDKEVKAILGKREYTCKVFEKAIC